MMLTGLTEAALVQGTHDLVQALVGLRESMCKDKKNTKPKRTPGGPKKFAVCADGKLVRFGDPNLEIKRDSAKRRKNFRARHNCDNPGPRTKAKYWACKTWEKGRTVSDVVEHRTPLKLLRQESVRSRTDPGMGGPPHSGGHPVGSPSYHGAGEWMRRAKTMRPGKKPPQRPWAKPDGRKYSRSADWEKRFDNRNERHAAKQATQAAGDEYLHHRAQQHQDEPQRPRPLPGSVPGAKTYSMVGEDKEKLDRSVPELAFKAREKAQDDEKAGHKEGAEYWRGWAAGSFLTGNKGLERGPLKLIK